jgi:hypothetical protein
MPLGPLALLILLSGASAWMARRGLERLESQPEALARAPLWQLVLLCCGASGLAFAVQESSHGDHALIRAFLVGQLVLAGWIDRQTTWVPDSLLLSVSGAAAAFILTYHLGVADMVRFVDASFWPGPAQWVALWPMTAVIVLSLICGGLIWLCAQALWWGQGQFGISALTPPDAVALALPILLFGFRLETALFFALVGVLALAMQRSHALRAVFSNEQAVRDGKADLGLGEDRHAVALLSLLFSLLALMIALHTPLQVVLAHWIIY